MGAGVNRKSWGCCFSWEQVLSRKTQQTRKGSEQIKRPFSEFRPRAQKAAIESLKSFKQGLRYYPEVG